MATWRWAVGMAIGAGLFLGAWGATGSAQPPADSAPAKKGERAAPFPFAKIADRYELRPTGGTAPWGREEVASLRWSNPVRRVDGGTVFLWCVAGRPRALLTLYTSQSGPPVIEHELSSLTDEPFVGTEAGERVWEPKEPGILWRPLAGGPIPAAGRPGRLSQLRQLAGEFTASLVKDENDRPSALRRLSSPIYRYPETAERDGALFAFAQATDPELVLLVETVPPATGTSGETAYRYAIARTTSYSLSVRRGDEVVWTAETWNWNTRNPSQPYTMRYTKEPALFEEIGPRANSAE